MVPYDKAYPPDFQDVPRRVPEMTKLKRLIAYEPRVSLEETLFDIVQYQRGRPEKAIGGPSSLGMAV
jgi:UDP-glucose 4-epimerase